MVTKATTRCACLFTCALLLAAGCSERAIKFVTVATVENSSNNTDWSVYGGNSAGDRYSEIVQITKENVRKLQLAWRYDTGPGGLQTSPLMIGSTLYAYTPKQSVIALDASTGMLKWQFNPDDTAEQPARGLTYWKDGSTQRLFAGAGTFLYAVDPDTGSPILGFGDRGKVDLRIGLSRDPDTLATFLTSPGIIYKDLIIVGFRTSETAPAAPGAVRAYDVRTGVLRWMFRLIPQPGERGHETWPPHAWREAGGANAWAGFALDKKRGIVYTPTGSAVDDFYGADRHGDNLYANSLVALNAATGERIWFYQFIRHDLWDWDLPSPPVLLTVMRQGRRIDAVAQTTKQGFVFLLDRETGTSLFPIEERPVRPSEVPGERSAPTQRVPLKPAPFARQRLTDELVTTRTPEVHAAAMKEFATFRNEGIFTPLAVGRQTVVFPGFDGGAEWGGAAVDRNAGVIYINSNDVAWLGGLVEPHALKAATRGAELYQTQCSVCHGLHGEGAPPAFPRLTDIASRLNPSQISDVIGKGRGRMPGFPQLIPADIAALVSHLTTESDAATTDAKREVQSPSLSAEHPRYLFTGYRKFLDADGYPAVKPPWGTLNAIDLNTGEYLWKIPLGEYPELAAQGIRNTGTENYGGPLVTASGLVFIGATIYDRKFRAFDARTGERIWETELPFAGNATPITYMTDGRQYIVIACGGSRNPKGPQGSSYVAFALQLGSNRQ